MKKDISSLYKKTSELLLRKINGTPLIAVVTGSGIKLFPDISPSFEIRYNALPIWSILDSSEDHIKGHEGKLKLFNINNKYVLVFSGRQHLYEGLDITRVVINIKIAHELGVKNIIVTNAAGGINKKFKAGSIMLISGFINFMQPTERGVIDSIVQKPKIVNTKLMRLVQKITRSKIKKGIYAGMSGPTYETYSEIKLLRLIGADAVGMSTIPELICANSLGMQYAGISVISNLWSTRHKPTHEKVLQNVQKANNRLNKLIINLLESIPSSI